MKNENENENKFLLVSSGRIDIFMLGSQKIATHTAGPRGGKGPVEIEDWALAQIYAKFKKIHSRAIFDGAFSLAIAGDRLRFCRDRSTRKWTNRMYLDMVVADFEGVKN